MGDYQRHGQWAGTPEYDECSPDWAFDRGFDRVGRVTGYAKSAPILHPPKREDSNPSSGSSGTPSQVRSHICACNFHGSPPGVPSPVLLCDHVDPFRRTGCQPENWANGTSGQNLQLHSVDPSAPGARTISTDLFAGGREVSERSVEAKTYVGLAPASSPTSPTPSGRTPVKRGNCKR